MTFTKVETQRGARREDVRQAVSRDWFLHVANGHCTTRLIELSGVPGRTEIWADPLNEGPVPGNVSDDELLQIRARLSAGDPDRATEVAADLKQMARCRRRRGCYDELVLWFEHDLVRSAEPDSAAERILAARPRSKPVTLICIDSYPGHPHFKGLGELAPAAIAALCSRLARPVTAETDRAGVAGVDARIDRPIRARSKRCCSDDTSALPFLAPALARHLEEFPSDVRWPVAQRTAADGAGARRVPPTLQSGVSADARRRNGVLHRRLVVLRSRYRAGRNASARRCM